MRPIFWLAAIASAGFAARQLAKLAPHATRPLALTPAQGLGKDLGELPTDRIKQREAIKQADPKTSRGLDGATHPTAATPDPAFTRSI